MFKIKYTDDVIVNETGLTIIGNILNNTDFKLNINNRSILKNGSNEISNYDVMATYIGCLAQAKSDFARTEEYRKDMFFKKAMMLDKRAPSEGILRQRLNAIGKDDMEAFKDIIDKTNIELLTSQKTTITPRFENYIPVDIDVSPHDNSGTKKRVLNIHIKDISDIHQSMHI